MSSFTSGELEVMTILWERGELKPAEIQEHFPREIKNPALRSYLTILCEKGHVTRRREGKAYYYMAKTERQNAMQSRLSQFIDEFCNGSVRSLLMNLVESDKLSTEDIEALQNLAEKKPKPKKQGREQS